MSRKAGLSKRAGKNSVKEVLELGYLGVKIMDDNDRKFFTEEKKRIIGIYRACEKEQERLSKEKEISPELDIDRLIDNEHHRIGLKNFYGAFGINSHFYRGGYEINDREFIEQIKIGLAKELVGIVEEELEWGEK
ncbi:MAG: hypothetical protein U9O96_01060 [Candidatus Thermoplasmatota archaeon]|nr:hypothetical protein [Candidatus Thermoplasmatota archaeon]